jgi:hypothetical protein
MVLDQKEILQINATILAGALIFLTLVATVGSTLLEVLYKNTALVFAAVIIITFSTSSLFSFRKDTSYSLTSMKAGFILFIIFALILIVMSLHESSMWLELSR